MSSNAEMGDVNVIRILLVDDIQEARDSIQRLLSFEQDLQVVGFATNGREGVAKAKELQPDIVIMDINMPDMDGLEAASLITKALPTVGVIMMSVQDDSDYLQKAMLAGARFFLSKPPTPDQLYNTIRNVYTQYAPIRKQMAALSQPGAMPARVDDERRGGGRKGHVIAVYSPQGGAGTTTIATSLASGLTKEGIKTLLIDADLEFGDVGAFLDLRSQSTLVDAVENAGDLDVEYFDSIVMTHNSGIKVLLGPSRPTIGGEIRSEHPERVVSIVEQVRDYYDFIVIDTPKSIDSVTARLLELADKVVLVVLPTLPAIKNVRLVIDMFDTAEFPPEKTMLTVNRAIENPSRSQKSYPTPDRISNYLKRPVEGVIPLVEEAIILNAINKGIPVIASDRDQSKAPIKQLLNLSNHVYSVLMGVEEGEIDDEETKEKRRSFFFGNR